MNISKFLSMAFVIAGIGLALGMSKNTITQVSAVNNNAQETCPDGVDGWEKVDGLSSTSYTYSVPSGKRVVEWCWKAANTVVYGTAGTPSTTTVTVNSTVFNSPGNPPVVCTAPGVPHNGCSIRNLSHASFKLELIPTRTFSCNDKCRETSQCQADLGPDYSCIMRPGENEGKCRLTANPEDNKCKVASCNERCLNDGLCATIGTGYTCYHPGAGDPTPNDWGYCRLVSNPTNDMCGEPTPTPTPTTTTDNTLSQLSTVDPSCESNDVKASHRVKFNNVDQKGIGVLFKYNGAEQKVLTGDDGWANVSFAYTGDAWVDSQPDGYPSAANFITKQTDCASGEVLGTTTEGQVLGAYAETGIVEDVIMSILGLAGVSMFTSGAVLHVKNRD